MITGSYLLRWLVTGHVVMLLTGCAYTPQSPQEITPEAYSVSHLERIDGLSLGDVTIDYEMLNRNLEKQFADAIRATLRDSNIFESYQGRRINVALEYCDERNPEFGAEKSYSLDCGYRYSDSFGAIDGRIRAVSEGRAAWNESFSGYERSINAIRRGIKKNIEVFTVELHRQLKAQLAVERLEEMRRAASRSDVLVEAGSTNDDSSSAAAGGSRSNKAKKAVEKESQGTSGDRHRVVDDLTRNVQMELARLGYYNGPIDGVYGELTRKAIIAFQGDIGEAQDGRVTEFIYGAMRVSSIEASRPPKQQVAQPGSSSDEDNANTERPSGQKEKGVGSDPPAEASRRDSDVGDHKESRSRPSHVEPIKDPELVSTASGVLINNKGGIITNYHAIDDCGLIRVKSIVGDREIDAELIASDDRNDLAYLRTSESMGDRFAKIANSQRLRLGDNVVVAGYPLSSLLGNDLSTTTGIVSKLLGPRSDSRVVQITAPVQPGSSGGPLLDERGAVVGIVVATIDALEMAVATGSIPQNVNFAIRSVVLTVFLDSHGVEYSDATHETRKTTPDIANIARDFTVLIRCFVTE